MKLIIKILMRKLNGDLKAIFIGVIVLLMVIGIVITIVEKIQKNRATKKLFQHKKKR